MPAPDDSEPNPPKETLPDVVGQNVFLARVLLTAQGFRVTVQEVGNPAAAGTVLAMNPSGGQDVEAGSNVVLMVSQGPDPQPRSDGGATSTLSPGAATVPTQQPATVTPSPTRRRGKSLFDVFSGN